MKRIFTFFLALIILCCGKIFGQACVSFGCAASHTGVITDGTLPDQAVVFPASACFNLGNTYKQIFWEFFYSPNGGDFAQSFTPTVPLDGLDIDWAVFEIPGGVPPTSVNCPVDPSAWVELQCNTTFGPGVVAGPGVDDIVTTVVNRYYAVAIVVYQGISNGGLANYSFDIGTPTIDEGLGGGPVALTAINCPPILLPVKLSSFGARVSNCAISLDWAAASEPGFKDYELQYSSDGSKYETIATVPAAGSNSLQNYSYQHTNPQQGKVYYRLKMVDIDGRFEYSRTIVMKLNCSKKQVFVYPNPVKDIVNINITNSRDNVTTAKLFDANGKLIYTGTMISGTNTINMGGFAKGIYMLKLISNTDTQNIKIIK